MGNYLHVARRRGALLFAVLLVLGNGLLYSVGVVSAQPSTLSGVFTTLFVDPPPGSSIPPREIYELTDAAGKMSELQIAPATLQAAGGGERLDRQRVTVTGTAAPTTQAAATPVIAVQSVSLEGKTALDAAPKRQAVTGGQEFVNVLCKFPDVAQEPPTPGFASTAAYVNSLMSPYSDTF